MAFRFDWEALISSPGVAATVQERLQSVIDEVADTRPPFLGPIEVTDVGFGAVAPQVELREISELDREVATAGDGSAPLLSPLCAKVFLQWDSDVTIGIATELKAPFGMVGLPLEGTLRGIDFEGVFVVEVDPVAGTALCFFEGSGEEEDVFEPGLRDCGPLRSLAVELAIGDENKLQDASKIEQAISDHLSKEIRERLVYPNGLKIPLPGRII